MSIFNDVLVKKPGRSLFNLSHERKFTGNFGWLYPILIVDTVPGDTFKISTEFLVRAAPLIAPVMHRVNVKINYFFVPHRLVWKDWPSFITGINQQQSYVDAGNSNNYFVNPVKPFAYSGYIHRQDETLLQDGSLMDFLGFPTMRPGADWNSRGEVAIDLLPFYSYHKIYVDWYRNQNVEGGFEGAHESGEHNNPNVLPYFHLRRRMWEKDYFTSALPFAQRGDPVEIPVVNRSLSFNTEYPFGTEIRNVTNNKDIDPRSGLNVDASTEPPVVGAVDQDGNNIQVALDNSKNLKSDVLVGTINDLRLATRIQRWLEKNARVGGRYIEQILAHFGIHSSDARLQRAEYLGGYSTPLVVSDVEQNSSTDGLNVSGTDTPQGHLAGKGVAYGNSKPIKCFCEEHGYIIGIMSILPRTTYQDGFPRMYKRNTRYDYYFPEFANLGEQEVSKSEVYFDIANDAQQSDDRFGFQERYCEYKYIPSTVHGEFKNNLQFWHLGRSFSQQPALNLSFVEANPRNSVFAVEDSNVADHFYINLLNNVTAMRPMPKQAIPTL